MPENPQRHVHRINHHETVEDQRQHIDSVHLAVVRCQEQLNAQRGNLAGSHRFFLHTQSASPRLRDAPLKHVLRRVFANTGCQIVTGLG